MRIFLVRHGESITNVDPSIYASMPDHAIPLSDDGITQSIEAGRFLDDYLGALPRDGAHFAVRMWASPYRRTRQTASPRPTREGRKTTRPASSDTVPSSGSAERARP